MQMSSKLSVNAPPGSPAPDRVTVPDGEALTVWRWPAEAGRPSLHWAHATGYHARAYTPLLDELSAFINVRAWDMRGHGASAAAGNPEMFRSWETYYRDLIALADAADAPLWLAGHSIGATASVMAAARRPEKVRGLLLAEPVLMDRRQGFKLAVAKLLRQSHRSGLAAGAARRRARFESRPVALENYRGRGGFKTWPEEWLAAYVEHGFVDDVDGGVSLAATPAWESATFTATEHNPWPGIRRLKCPVIALGAEVASTFSGRSRRLFVRLAPQAAIETVAETTHFLPMERPGAVLDAARHLVGTVPGDNAYDA